MIPQSRAQWLNLAVFVGVVAANIVVISVAAALGADTMPGFRDGELLRPGRETAIGLLALLAPIISGWIVQNRPRFGSEGLAADVDAKRDQGYHRDQLTVVPKPGAVPDGATSAPQRQVIDAAPLTPEQLAQAVAAVKAEMRSHPGNTDDAPSRNTADQVIADVFGAEGRAAS